MTDKQRPASGVAMIRIDGARVRQLREERGLTQLYLATAVGVTTDTISRWENRHYPTIKEENGLRLAEVLEVEVDDLLETTASDQGVTPATEKTSAVPATRAGLPLQVYTRLINLALAIMIIVVIGLFIWKKNLFIKPPAIEAVRFLPLSCAPGMTFPVLISLQGADDNPVLVQESLPHGLEVVSTIPVATSASDGVLKWLRKQQDSRQRFIYLVRAAGANGEVLHVSGSIKVSKGSGRIAVSGGQDIRLAPVHWADRNGDFVINDDEILQVYDHFGNIPAMVDALNTIEEIWLGSGYRWNEKGKTIEILP